MSPELIKIYTQARISKLCLDHFGFLPNHSDIVQKLHHINRIDNKAPCDMVKLKKHIIKTMMRFIANNYPLEKKKVIQIEIDRIKRNPTKQLPLP